MKPSKLFVLGLIAVAMTFVSCSGEDGERGPQGESGESIKGEPGNPGDPGADGSANAITYDLNFDSSPVGKSEFAFGGLIQLSQEVLRDDTILVYFVKGDADTIYPVPGTSLDGTANIRVLMQPQSLIFNVFDWNGQPVGLPGAQVDYVKLVIIENTGIDSESTNNGSNKTIAQLKAVGVDVNDYESVANHFNLK
ncbi:MAG: collagen-like protein [Bacteroidota bacterium]